MRRETNTRLPTTTAQTKRHGTKGPQQLILEEKTNIISVNQSHQPEGSDIAICTTGTLIKLLARTA